MTVDDYIDTLPEDQRIAIRSVREVVNSRLPLGYEEGVVHDTVSWFVPFTRLAETYNNQPLCIVSLGSTKGDMTLHLMSIDGDAELRRWFEAAYESSGKTLEMDQACLRFKDLDALALDVIGELVSKVSVDDFVDQYERNRPEPAAAQPRRIAPQKPAKQSAKKPAPKRKAKIKIKIKIKTKTKATTKTKAKTKAKAAPKTKAKAAPKTKAKAAPKTKAKAKAGAKQRR